MENLFEVQVFFTDLEFEIFQFTNKNKRGSMSFTITPNGKMQKCNKKQFKMGSQKTWLYQVSR